MSNKTYIKMNEDKKINEWSNYKDIKQFDVVYTLYPYSDKEGNRVPPDKPHYCVVLESLGYDNKLKANVLTVAYGTSNFTKRNPTDLMVNLESLINPDYTGLYRNTKFEFHNRIPLAYTYENFINPEGFSSPLVGSLDISNEPDLLDQMKKIAEKLSNDDRDSKV